MTTGRAQVTHFRPFEIPEGIESFLSSARLLVGETGQEAIDANSRSGVDIAELQAGLFSLQIAGDEESFARIHETALSQLDAEDGPSVDLVVVLSTSYLKLAEVILRTPFANVTRLVQLHDAPTSQLLNAVHHGCDIDAYLCLTDEREHQPLKPWRKGTWLSRAQFRLRTEIDGVGYNVVPLTDEKREAFGLHKKTLRYVVLDESPLAASPTSEVTLYLDEELLSRLKRSPKRDWAKAFTDQLAVDVLSAIAMHAVADPDVHDAVWSSVRDTMLGSLIMMVDGRPADNEAERDRDRQQLLDMLRTDPLRFIAAIEGACAMRDAVRSIVGGGE